MSPSLSLASKHASLILSKSHPISPEQHENYEITIDEKEEKELNEEQVQVNQENATEILLNNSKTCLLQNLLIYYESNL